MRITLICIMILLISGCNSTKPPQPLTRTQAVHYSPQALEMSAESMQIGELRELTRQLENIRYTATDPDDPVQISVTALQRKESWKLGYLPISWVVRGTANMLARASDGTSEQTHLWVTVSNSAQSEDYYIEGGHFTKKKGEYYDRDFDDLITELQDEIDADF